MSQALKDRLKRLLEVYNRTPAAQRPSKIREVLEALDREALDRKK